MSTSATKTRNRGVYTHFTSLGRVGNISMGNSLSSYSRGVETIISGSHPWPPKSLAKSGRVDYGGEMALLRSSREIWPTGPISGTGAGGFMTEGTSFIPNTLPSVSPAVPISGFTMSAIGTKGWNRFKPTARKGGLDQFLGELRQLPKAFAVNAYKNALKEIARGRFGNVSSKGISKNAADDYLNFQFGWLPIYRDIQDLLALTLVEDKLFKQLVRDNGRAVRRSGTVDIVTDTQSSEVSGPIGNYLFPYLQSQFYGGNIGKQTTTIRQNERYWFSGRFRYYMPELSEGIGSDQARNRARRIIYGAELTPSTLYQLTPWSWLVDWAAPVGDIVSNLNDYGDNLTADYAYAMGHRSTETTIAVTGVLQGRQIRTFASSNKESKKRTKASPFGFGFNPGTLNPFQVSILAALGISRWR